MCKQTSGAACEKSHTHCIFSYRFDGAFHIWHAEFEYINRCPAKFNPPPSAFKQRKPIRIVIAVSIPAAEKSSALHYKRNYDAEAGAATVRL